MRTVFTAVTLIASFVCSASLTSHAQGKSKKHPLPPPPPLPVGSTGPLPQMPLDAMSPEPPRVHYRDGELTIIAPNSTLTDILRCVREQTGAEIEIPAANDRVVARLGPGPVSEILSELLNGSHFNYVLMGSPGDPTHLTRVVLLSKAQPDVAMPAQAGALNRVPPTRPPVIHHANEARANDRGVFPSQPEIPNQPEATPNQEVTPPPPTDAVDSAD